MTLIVDTSVKKGCCCLTFYGGATTLFKYPPQLLLCYPQSNNNIKMMENTNATATKAGVIAVLIDKSPTSYPDGSCIPHRVALIQGILNNHTFAYHEWKFCGSNDELRALVTSSCTNTYLNSILFEDEPTFVPVQSTYVMYFNQIAGPHHISWQRNIMITDHPSGSKVLQSALTQDNWGRGLYMPKSVEYKFKFYRFNSNVHYLPSVSVPKRKSIPAKTAGLSPLSTRSDQQTVELYCLKQDVLHMEAKYVVPIPSTRSDEYQEFVTLTLENNKALNQLCKAGPIPTKLLNKTLQNLIDKGESSRIRVRRMCPLWKEQKFKYVVSVVNEPLTAEDEW